MAQQSTLKDRMVEQAAKSQLAPADNKPIKTIADYINRMKGEIAKALPKHITADRLARVALTTIRMNPKLQECSVESLLAGIMQAAQLGLEPGLLGQCYLVPYGKEAQFIIGYKGMIDLMWRSGMYKTLFVEVVCENDEFVYERGSEPKLIHKPRITGDRGKPIGYYLFAEYQNGGKFWHFMTIQEIERHRARSRAKDNGPWVTDYDAMCRKTVVRDASRWMPMSIELQRQLAQDGLVKREIDTDMTEVPGINPDVMEADFRVMDEPAGDTEGEVS